jgi:hypothetical protein
MSAAASPAALCQPYAKLLVLAGALVCVLLTHVPLTGALPAGGARGGLGGGLGGGSRGGGGGGGARGSCGAPPALDYLEIGTSDFNTIVQSVDALGGAAGWFREPLRGASVDAMQLYLDALPTLAAHHRKANFAVTGVVPHAATLPVFFIDPRDIAAEELPDWLKGCNKVGSAHPAALELLASWKGKDRTRDLLKTADVPVAALPELLLRAGACRLSVLRVDVEGLDAELMLAYAAFLWAHPQCRADLLLFEEMTWGHRGRPAADYPGMFPAVFTALRALGYEMAPRPLGPQGYPVRDGTWVWSAARDARLWAARAALAAAAPPPRAGAPPGAPLGALDDAALDALLLRGRGGEGDGEGDVGAAEADAIFDAACAAPVPPPAAEFAHLQGRSPNATHFLRRIVMEKVRRRA